MQAPGLTRCERIFLKMVCAALTLALAAAAHGQACPGDCNGDRQVTIDENLLGIAVGLKERELSDCRPADVDGDGEVIVNELVSGMLANLRGCPPTPTPSLTPTATPTFTPTSTPSHTFTPTSTPTPTLAPLSLEAQLNPDPIVAGETLTGVITLSNVNPDDLLNVEIDARVPNFLDSFSAALAGADRCVGGASASCESGDRIIWTADRVVSGGSFSVTFTAAVQSGASAPAPGSELDLEVVARVGGRQGASTSTSAFVAAGPRSFDLTLRGDRDPVAPEEPLVYTLSFGNRTLVMPAASAVLRLVLPEDVGFVSASDGGVEEDGVVEWTLGTLNPGQGGERQVRVTVNSGTDAGSLRAAAELETSATTVARASLATQVQEDAPLSLGIEVNPGPAQAQDILTVAVTVTNRGETDLLGVTARMIVPAGIAGFTASLATPAATCVTNLVGGTMVCEPREPVTWNLGTLRARTGVTLRIPLTSIAGFPSGASIPFDVTATDASGFRASAGSSVVILSDPLLELAVRAEHDPAAPEELLTYIVSFGNRTQVNPAPTAVLRVPIPAGTAFSSASDGGVPTNGVIEWALGTLDPGESGERKLQVRVEPDAADGAILRAGATIHSASAPIARAETTTRVESEVPLRLSLELNPDPVEPQDILTAALTVTNRGNASLLGVNALLGVPRGIGGFTASLATGMATCPTNLVGSTVVCEPRERVVWDIGRLDPGAGVTVKLPLAAAAVPSGTVISFDANAADQSGFRAAAGGIVTVLANPLLELSLREDLDPVVPDEVLTYTLTFGNPTAVTPAPNTVLRLPLPTGTSFVSVSHGGTFAGGTAEWNLGTLQPGEGGERQLRVMTDSDLTDGTIISAAAAISSAAVPVARAETDTRVESDVALSIGLELNPDPVRPQELLMAAATVTNHGSLDLLGVLVEMVLPRGLAGTSALLATPAATCPTNLVGSTVVCDPRERVVWDLGRIAAGTGLTVRQPLAAANVPGGTVIPFEVSVRDQSGAATPTRIRRAITGGGIVVNAAPLLELAMQEDKDPVAPEGLLTYTIGFGNPTQVMQAPAAVLRVPLPTGTEFVSASDGGMLGQDGVVEWTLGTVSPGGVGERRLQVMVASDAFEGELLKAAATISSATVEVARAESVTRVESEVALDMAMELNPDPAQPQDILSVSLTIANRGDTDLLGVTAVMFVPRGITPFTAALAAPAATCNTNLIGSTVLCNPGERVTWELGRINAGTGLTAHLPLSTPAEIAPGTVIAFEGFVFDASGIRAGTGSVVEIASSPPLELAVRETPDPTGTGNVLTYTLTFGNRSMAVVNTDALRMPLPEGTGFMAASEGGAVNGDGVVEWPLGMLAAGAGGVRQLQVEVAGGTADGTVIAGEATIDSGGASVVRAESAARVQDDAPLTLEIELDPPATPANTFTQVTLTVTNETSVTMLGVTVDLIVPRRIASFGNASIIGGSCTTNLVGSTVTCEPRERVRWNVGTLAGETSVSVELRPTIAVGTPNGTVITFDALAQDGSGVQATATAALRVVAP